ncbi:MAG TPA: cupredoxin family copper-binding protein [Pseudolabrys sp.]|nr:cupredoxin family copper-binding protein [Pseudolabrys sp.]
MTPRWIFPTALVLCWLGSVSAHADTIQVTIDKLVFAPTEITAKVGDTIEWVNKDILAHTATATNKDWDVMIGPKQTAKLVLKKTGPVDFFCKFHPNMKGHVTVAP